MAKVTRAKAKRARPKSKAKSKSKSKSKPKPKSKLKSKPRSKPRAKLKSAGLSIGGRAIVGAGETQTGNFPISGPDARERCVYWNNEKLYVDFTRRFRADPQVTATGRATNPQDRVYVTVLTTYGGGKGFYCMVTTYGQVGHGICDPAYIDWKASL